MGKLSFNSFLNMGPCVRSYLVLLKINSPSAIAHFITKGELCQGKVILYNAAKQIVPLQMQLNPHEWHLQSSGRWHIPLRLPQ